MSHTLESLSNQIGRRAPISGQIAESIRTLIVAGDLQPGSRIVESRIARQIGVGQPMKEAASQKDPRQFFDLDFGFTTRSGSYPEIAFCRAFSSRRWRRCWHSCSFATEAANVRRPT
jgi:hypothetical protein